MAVGSLFGRSSDEPAVDRDRDGVDDRVDPDDDRRVVDVDELRSHDSDVRPDGARHDDVRRDDVRRDDVRRDDVRRDDVRPYADLPPVAPAVPASTMHRSDTDAPAVDRDRDGVDDRVEARERVDARDHADARDRVEARDTSPAPAPAPVVGRTSFLATLALMTGTAATLASLSGRLAPVGVALGVLALLFALGGVSASGRRTVNGRGVASLALLTSLAAIALGGLAMSGTLDWLSSDVDNVSRLRDWLDARLTFMSGW